MIEEGRSWKNDSALRKQIEEKRKKEEEEVKKKEEEKKQLRAEKRKAQGLAATSTVKKPNAARERKKSNPNAPRERKKSNPGTVIYQLYLCSSQHRCNSFEYFQVHIPRKI